MVGRSPSSGNDTTSSHSSKLKAKYLRQMSLSRPQCMRLAMSFLDPKIRSISKFEGSPPSGNDSSSEQYSRITA
ncbi:hypothetical protein ACFX16_039996 [Malus domestica]